MQEVRILVFKLSFLAVVMVSNVVSFLVNGRVVHLSVGGSGLLRVCDREGARTSVPTRCFFH